MYILYVNFIISTFCDILGSLNFFFLNLLSSDKNKSFMEAEKDKIKPKTIHIVYMYCIYKKNFVSFKLLFNRFLFVLYEYGEKST